MINNKYYAIDCHCHIYPEKIASRAVGGTDAFYGSVSVGSGLVEDMLARADRAGIDRALVQSVATTPHQVRSINNFIAAEVAKHPDRLIGFGALPPPRISREIFCILSRSAFAALSSIPISRISKSMIIVPSRFMRPVSAMVFPSSSMRVTDATIAPIPIVLFLFSASIIA